MAFQNIAVTPLTPHIGAEIGGVDLSRQLGNQQFQEVHDALIAHQVIFFRDQQLSIEQHKEFAGRFGKLHVHPAAPKIYPDHPEILVIKADEKSKHVAGEEWHSDVSFEAEPPLGSVLYLTEVPPLGGDTLFASGYSVYDALSVPMQRLLEGLTAIHDGNHVFAGAYGKARYGRAHDGPPLAASSHPVIRTHPVSGRKAVFVNRGFTTGIVGLSKAESAALLEMLYRLFEVPEYQCRFRWRANSVAFWDNRCAQHHAMFDYFPQRRFGHRVTICGDKPFYRG